MRMFDFVTLFQQGNGWLFIPGAVLLGALHGLEPGHSKTMMAAFIVAIRGSVRQAVMLGLAATVSHTLVVWLVALLGSWLSQRFTVEALEPWLQLLSGLIIAAIALWMIGRSWAEERNWRRTETLRQQQSASQRLVDTGHGLVELALEERDGEAWWQLRCINGQPWAAAEVSVATLRGSGFAQLFTFERVGAVLRSVKPVPAPHHFTARLKLSHGGHAHDYDLPFTGSTAAAEQPAVFEDAHQRAHAREIEKRFQGQRVSNGQILLFGLTGGLIPCPAAVTVLLLCMQLKQLALGSLLVLSFSLGLALTLVSVGVAAALSVNQIARRWSGFDRLAQRAPWLSGLLMLLIAGYMALHGWQGLNP